MRESQVVLRAMDQAIAQLRHQVNTATRSPRRSMEHQSALPAHRQLSWLVPLRRSLNALSQQPAYWEAPLPNSAAVKACVACFEELARQIRSFRYGDPSHFGPIVTVPLLFASKGVPPSQWPVMTLAEFVAQESETLKQAAALRQQAAQASEAVLVRFLDGLQSDQQVLLIDALAQADASGNPVMLLGVLRRELKLRAQ